MKSSLRYLLLVLLATAMHSQRAFAQLRLQETGGTPNEYVGFKAPTAVTTNILWTLPAIDGSANQCLATDGSGNLSWISPGGSSLPLSALTSAAAVNSLANANFAQTWSWNTLTTQTAMTMNSSSLTTGNVLSLTASNNSAGSTGNVLKVTSSGASSNAVPVMITQGGASHALRVNDDGTDADTTPFVVTAAGRVGIGTATPATAADINGTVKTSIISVANPGATGFDLLLGNIHYTALSCTGTTWTVNNMVSGATYTVVVQGNAHTGSCIFSDGASTFKYVPANNTPNPIRDVIYSLTKVGTVVYVSWIDGWE